MKSNNINDNIINIGYDKDFFPACLDYFIENNFTYEDILRIIFILPSNSDCHFFAKIIASKFKKDFAIIPKIIAYEKFDELSLLLPNSTTQKNIIKENQLEMFLCSLIKRNFPSLKIVKFLSLVKDFIKFIKIFRENNQPIANIKFVEDYLSNKLDIEMKLIIDFLINEYEGELEKEDLVDEFMYKNIQALALADFIKENNVPIAVLGLGNICYASTTLIKSIINSLDGRFFLYGLDEPDNKNYLTQICKIFAIEKKDIKFFHQPTKNNSEQTYICYYSNDEKTEAQNIAYLIQEKRSKFSTQEFYIATSNKNLALLIEDYLNIWKISCSSTFNKNHCKIPFIRFIFHLLHLCQNIISQKELDIACLFEFLTNSFLFCFNAKWVSFIYLIDKKMKEKLVRAKNFDSFLGFINSGNFDSDEHIDAKSDLHKLKFYIHEFCFSLVKGKYEFAEILEKFLNLLKLITRNGFYSEEEKKIIEHLLQINNANFNCDFEEFKFYLSNYIEKINLKNKNANAFVFLMKIEEVNYKHSENIIICGANNNIWPSGKTQNLLMIDIDLIKLTNEKFKLLSADYIFESIKFKKNLIFSYAKTIGSKSALISNYLLRLKLDLKANLVIKSFYEIEEKIRLRNLILNKKPISPPHPCPDQKFKPLTVYVTQIEKLINSPYSFYANKILELKKLTRANELMLVEYGIIVHNLINDFSKIANVENISLWEEFFVEKIEYYKNKYFEDRSLQAEKFASKLKKLASWIMDYEHRKRKVEKKQVFSETEGSILYENCIIKARADRIEVDNNEIIIIDFKTGNLPSPKDLADGSAPQLTLEGLLALAGGFNFDNENNKFKDVKLKYISIHPYIEQVEELEILNSDELVNNAKLGLKKLLRHYLKPNSYFTYYPSNHKNLFFDDYAHLARVKEWK